MVIPNYDYPEGVRSRPDDPRKKVGAKYAVYVLDLQSMDDPAAFEDAVWARLEEQIKELVESEHMRRVRGIERSWTIHDLGGVDTKEYRAQTLATPIDAPRGWD